MSTSFDSSLPSWDEQENQSRRELKSRVWRELKTILNWMLIFAVVVLGIWVLILKLSHEPGIHLQLYNETSQKLKDVKLKFTWSEYVMPELPTGPKSARQRYYGAIIQKVVWMDEKASVLTIEWIDSTGAKQQHVEKDMYLTGESELIVVTFQPNGTVSVKYKGLSFF